MKCPQTAFHFPMIRHNGGKRENARATSSDREVTALQILHPGYSVFIGVLTPRFGEDTKENGRVKCLPLHMRLPFRTLE